MNRSHIHAELVDILRRRLLILDGGMGTMIQTFRLSETDFRNEKLVAHSKLLQGNNDLLSITRPDVIRSIHANYLRAGSDVIETNTFSSNSIAQADYDLQPLVHEMNRASVRLAKEAVAEVTALDKTRRCFIAGAIGPTNRARAPGCTRSSATMSSHLRSGAQASTCGASRVRSVGRG